jgi:hypothetical protein
MSADQSVIKIVQELLSAEPTLTITPALISEKIELALALNPRWAEGFDREKATNELIRRFSMWIGQDTSLRNMVGHEAWLDAARKQNWRYWQRYREWTERKLSSAALDGLDTSTDNVLGLLEDPRREGNWDRRGLVVGHVQSGKTGHYSGLISKAADSGYKIIIVLAGLHNNLRSQTQVRLDEGFLGYETAPNVNDIRAIGVGLIDADPNIRPNFATNRTNSGDFNTAFAKNLGISPEQRPWLFVVKKNKTVLTRLLEWIHNRVADAAESGTGRKVVTNLPLLMIDDEADHASVDTGQQEFDENGRPDTEYEPKAINSLIRQILHSFQKKAYVGYTATPFANIFIHERGRTAEEGEDLFPAAFIINLGAPSNYVGPSQIFGVNTPDGRTPGLPLLRTVDDHTDWMPPSHKSHHQPETADPSGLPPSLRKSIHAFLLATAVRYLRGQRSEHSSMLIHVTRFNNVQRIVHEKVAEYFRHLKQRLVRGIGSEMLEAELAQLWTEDFVLSGDLVRERLGEEIPIYPSWAEIRGILVDVCEDVEVRMINGTAKDALDYTDNATGLKVIAIGGDKLSRGLTLEGLVTSYFLRASKMYDTLMQMGRWFGYRPGYLDVCRLYTTSDLQEWFGHIADAAAELREEFELMAASGATPREYGLKVQSHPVLMVTSRLKMRTAETLLLSFSGSLVETVSLFRDRENLGHNLRATESFLSGLQSPQPIPLRTFGDSTSKWNGHVWEGVPGTKIADFMETYRTQPAAYKVNSPLIADFIRKMNAANALTGWTVVLLGGGAGESVTLAPGATVSGIKRSAEKSTRDTYSIGRLISPRDETLDFSEEAWLAALKLTQDAYTRDPEKSRAKSLPEEPNGPAIRRIRGKGAFGVPAHPERGLLLLYAIDPKLSDLAEDLPTVIGFAASFPASDTGVKVQYKVNNVFMELEYGSGG